ncbi:MAG: PPC domain-containing protein, partial [Planctomycetales bacterium]|nr:PPC domain-containing protein [Planctomycetales bacterium]
RKGRGSAGTPFQFRVAVPKHQLPGVIEYRVATRQAVSSVAQLLVTDFPVANETDQENGSAATAQDIKLPVAMCGVCEKFEDVDCYRFAGQAGQAVTIQIFAQRVTERIHGMVVRGPRIYLMDPILTLIGPNGQVLAQNDNYFGGDSWLHAELPIDGQYVLEVRDARYAGDTRYAYCVEFSSAPFAHSLFPLAVQQSSPTTHELIGVGLGETRAVATPLQCDQVGWRQVRVETQRGLTNPVPLLVSPHPQMIEQEPNNSATEANPISLPQGVNGRLQEADDADGFRFTATKGQAYRFEVEAARQGLALDSVLELYDAEGKLLAEADDIANPRAKDSELVWTAPADGEFVIAVRDLHGRGGERFVYHLRAELAEPDFVLTGEYYYSMIAPGGHMMWFAKVDRRNGFDGPVDVEVQGLPAGVTATPVTIPAGMNHCAIILNAAADAQINASLVRTIGRARIKGSDGAEREIVRQGHITCEQQSSGGGQARWPINTQVVGVTRPLDLKRVTATPTDVTLRPGESAEITVRIERNPEFKDAVSLAMSFDYFATKFGEQLPPGITMGSKSTVRLTGDVLEGKIILEANDKPLAVNRLPIAVLARVAITFSITTNYASNPVYLTVEPAKAE